MESESKEDSDSGHDAGAAGRAVEPRRPKSTRNGDASVKRPLGMLKATEKVNRLGERVRAKIDGWDQFFQGVITKCNDDGTSFQVSFDDGEVVGSVQASQIEKEQVHVEYAAGDRIEAKIEGWDKHYPGTVVEAAGHGSYHAKFDDGEEVRFLPWDLMRRERPKLHKKGTRVMATISTWKDFYPGTVQSGNLNGTYQILFDDGDIKDSIPHKDVHKLEEEEEQEANAGDSEQFKVDDRVSAKIQGWDQFYEGFVKKVNGDGTYCIHFDDGEIVEKVKTAQMKQHPGVAESPTAKAFEKGDRVSAKIDGWDQYYQGQVEKVNGDGSYRIHFDDGEIVEKVETAQIKHLTGTESPAATAVEKGNRVSAKIDGWDQYYQGQVEKVNPDGTLCIHFDDGEVVQSVKLSQTKIISKDDSSNKSSSAKIQVGDRVSAKIDGWDQYYDGTVSTVNPDGSYCVHFDDGEVVEKVCAQEIKIGAHAVSSKPQTKPKFKKGFRVGAKIAGWDQYYQGVVSNVNADGSYCVSFDDGEVVQSVQEIEMVPGKPKIGEKAGQNKDASGSNDKSKPAASEPAVTKKTSADSNAKAKAKSTNADTSAVEGQRGAKPTTATQDTPAEKSKPDENAKPDQVKPVVEKEKSVAKREQPVAKEEKPVAKEEKPVAKEEKPVAKEEDPVVKEEEPVVKEDKPVVKEDKPAAEEESPAKEKNAAEEAGTEKSEELNQATAAGEGGDATAEDQFAVAGGDEAMPVQVQAQVVEQNQEPIRPKATVGPEAETNEQSSFPTPRAETLQVLQCRFRNALLSRSRNRDGKCDPQRAIRPFIKRVIKGKSQNSIVDLEAFKAALVSFGISDLSQGEAMALAEMVAPGVSKSRSVTLTALEEFAKSVIDGSGKTCALEQQLRRLANQMGSLHQAFEEFDQDGSGTVSASELCAVFQKASKGESMSLEMAEAIIKQFDENGDMQLDEKEFARFVLPNFALYVTTPVGQMFLAVDPNTTIAQLKTLVKRRIGIILGPAAESKISAQRIKLAKHFGTMLLESPVCNSSMSVMQVLSHGEQIFVVFDSDKGEFRYHSTKAQQQRQRRPSANSTHSSSSLLRIDSETRRGDELLPCNDATATRGKVLCTTSNASCQGPPSFLDRDARVAYQRLQAVFEMLDEDESGTLSKNELMYQSKHKPQLKKLLRGSPVLSQLLDNPAKVLSKVRGKDAEDEDAADVSFDELAKILIPQLQVGTSATRAAKSGKRVLAGAALGTATTASSQNRWKQLRVAKGAMATMSSEYNDSGAKELEKRYEAMMGERETLGLSQEARARLMSVKGAPSDIKTELLVERDAAGKVLVKGGGSPTETQQWVNAVSSDTWLGLSAKERKKRLLSKQDAVLEKLGVPNDPFKWSTRDVKKWLTDRVELPRYAALFSTITGSELLGIQTEHELEDMGIVESSKVPMAGLHRKKLMTHINILRKVRRGHSKRPNEPEGWAVADVLDWLRVDVGCSPQVVRHFKDKSIDGCVLKSLTDTDLHFLIGIQDKALRRKLLSSTAQLFPAFHYDQQATNGAQDRINEPPPAEWDQDRVAAFISQVLPGISLAPLRSTENNNFRCNGKALLALESVRDVLQVAPFSHLVHGDQAAARELLHAIVQLRKEQVETHLLADTSVNALIMGDIQDELGAVALGSSGSNSTTQKGLPRGSGPKAARALNSTRPTIIKTKPIDNPESILREAAESDLNFLIDRLSPAASRKRLAVPMAKPGPRVVIDGGATGLSCFKAAQAVVMADGERHARVIVDSWFDSDARQKISRDRLFDAISNRLDDGIRVSRQSFDRMWQDVFKLAPTAEIQRSDLLAHLTGNPVIATAAQSKSLKARGIHVRATSVPDRDVESNAAVKHYLRLLSEAIGKIRVLDFKSAVKSDRVAGSYHRRSQAEISKIVARVQDLKKTLDPAMYAEDSTPKQLEDINRLEEEFDRALLGVF